MIGCLCLLWLAVQATEPVLLQQPLLDESSGVCVTQRGQVVWSHNDSGGKARVFGFDRAGKYLVEMEWPTARAIDWEDMCAFQVDGKTYLAVGDVGDNNHRRSNVQIYVAPAPEVDLSAKAPVRRVADGICCLTVTYPDGPVNCEALAYDAQRKKLVLATKETLRCRFFEVDAADLSRDRTVTARQTGALVLPLVTGADISSGGQYMLLSTYGPACLLKRNAAGDWQTRGDQAVRMISLPPRRQGESVCFDHHPKRLLVTSEFAPTPLFSVSWAAPPSPSQKADDP